MVGLEPVWKLCSRTVVTGSRTVERDFSALTHYDILYVMVYPENGKQPHYKSEPLNKKPRTSFEIKVFSFMGETFNNNRRIYQSLFHLLLMNDAI